MSRLSLKKRQRFISQKKDIEEVGPEDVFRPTVMDNIVPASPEVV